MLLALVWLELLAEEKIAHRLIVIRALYHSTGGILTKEVVHKLPLKEIGRLKEKNSSPALDLSCGNDAPEAVAMTPNLGITEIAGSVALGQKLLANNNAMLLKADTVSAFCQALNLTDAFAALILDKAGIHEPKSAVVHHCTTREATVLITIVTGCESNGKIFPVGQIIADNVSPMHRSPPDIIRVMLEKRMVLTVIINQSVRIVYPAPLTGYVKNR